MPPTRTASEDSPPINADFLGGPPGVFEKVGREQLAALLDFELSPTSRVLDVGCGCLRGGRWVIPLLEPGHWHGIEPNRAMVERGLREFISPELVAVCKPRFDHNDRFDFTVFGTSFTHVIARSIWTHASRGHIEAMLDSFAGTATDDGVFLASYNPAKRFGGDEYLGDAWVGKSHESSEGGMVRHRFAWIASACQARGLEARKVDRPIVNGQPWIAITRR